jgi:hypothetical protein
MAAPSSPVLDISTFSERQFIRVNGDAYEIRNPHEVSLSQQIWLERRVPRVGELIGLADAGELDEPGESELRMLLDRIVRIVLEAPDALFARLPDAVKLATFHAFLRLPTVRTGRTAATRRAVVPQSSQTGSRSSRRSRGSTAAPQRTGGSASR